MAFACHENVSQTETDYYTVKKTHIMSSREFKYIDYWLTFWQYKVEVGTSFSLCFLIDVLIELFYVFHETFISKLLVLNCQCSGLAPALCSQY